MPHKSPRFSRPSRIWMPPGAPAFFAASASRIGYNQLSETSLFRKGQSTQLNFPSKKTTNQPDLVKSQPICLLLETNITALPSPHVSPTFADNRWHSLHSMRSQTIRQKIRFSLPHQRGDNRKILSFPVFPIKSTSAPPSQRHNFIRNRFHFQKGICSSSTSLKSLGNPLSLALSHTRNRFLSCLCTPPQNSHPQVSKPPRHMGYHMGMHPRPKNRKSGSHPKWVKNV